MKCPLRSAKWPKRFFGWAGEHKLALLILALLFAEHLAGIFSLKLDYNLNSDDMAYINAGINFIKTGTISCHGDLPSAQIMPGAPVLMGLFYLFFGQGTAFWVALKLAWGIMGLLTAWFTYRTVRLFAPKWAGLLAMLPFFRPDIVWMNNIPLTETPFLLCLSQMIYFTFQLGRQGSWKYFWGCAVSYLCALMLKANIAPYPALVLIYLLITKYDRKKLLKQAGVLIGMVLLLLIPWSIRNYIQFKAFIPLTYGAGNPMLLGTYQGTGYPSDEELDYTTNVEAVLKEQFADYYAADGTVLPEYANYISLQRDAIKAKYRISEWVKKDPVSFVLSYAVLKPVDMIKSYFYWEPVWNISDRIVNLIQWMDTLLCVIAVVLSLVLKHMRRPVLYLAGVYLVNVIIYATNFSFSRYNASLMCLRFALIGFACYLMVYALALAIRDINGKAAP